MTDVFAGQPYVYTGAAAFESIQIGGLFQTELGLANRLYLTDDDLLANVRLVQERSGVEKVATLQGRDFSIEMETGTGKTYVYLRTIFEMNKLYGFKKFIIVVPSVATREGALKSIDITKEHFQTLYEKAPFDHFVYDSRRLGKVRQFATSNQIQIMVINIHSFQKDVADRDLSEMTEDELKKLNVINRENDRMSGRRPIELSRPLTPSSSSTSRKASITLRIRAARSAISILFSRYATARPTVIPTTRSTSWTRSAPTTFDS